MKADLPGGLPRNPSAMPGFVCWEHWLGIGCWQSTDICVPLGATFNEAALQKADKLDADGKRARLKAQAYGTLASASSEQICRDKKEREIKLEQIRTLKEFADRWATLYGADKAEHFTSQMDALACEAEDIAHKLEKIESNAIVARLQHELYANAERCAQAAATIRASIDRKRPRDDEDPSKVVVVDQIVHDQ